MSKERPKNLQGYFDIFNGLRRTIPDPIRTCEVETDMPSDVRPAIEVIFLQNTDSKPKILEQYGMNGANEIFMPDAVKKN